MIAHRGASGERPEHTIAAYELALEQGADFVELDLVPTRDGHLIARHENALAMVELDAAGEVALDESGRPRVREATTDVADRPEFADRLAVKVIDGRRIGGWFSEDFTLKEIHRLRARERMPALRPASRHHDGLYRVPTLEEVIALVQDWVQSEDSDPLALGLYIELKHPTYFRHEGVRVDGEPIRIDLGESLIEALVRSNFVAKDRIFIQCFEVAPLIELKDRMQVLGLELPLVQLFGDVFNRRYRAGPYDMRFQAAHGTTDIYGELANVIEGGIGADISYAELATPAVLEQMARRYAAGIGPPRSSVMLTQSSSGGGPETFTGRFGSLLADARRAGLLVHPWTLRAERPFLMMFKDRPLDMLDEAGLLLRAGVDGFFTDHPAKGRLAVDRFQRLSTGGRL